MNDDDPGWPRVPNLWLLLVPGVGLRRAVRSKGDGLLMLRSVTVTFSFALLLFGVVITFLPDLPDGPVVPWVPLLLGLAGIDVVAERLAEPLLDCSSEQKLATSYRARFFVRIAFADSVALVGFAFVFIGAPTWLYYVGAAFSLARIWTHAAPTRAALERDQERLGEKGCRSALVATLRSQPVTR